MRQSVETARQSLLARLRLERAPRDFEQALTHPSYAHEHRGRGAGDYQRLEFLGDAVLDLCVSEMLLEILSDSDEGTLSRAYGAMVNGESLARWARENGVGPALLVGKGANASGIRERTNVLADAVEAIVGAVYLDFGLEGARLVTRIVVEAGLARAAELSRRDPKTALQELAQAHGEPAPRYRLIAAEGPDHDREFVVGVEIAGELVAEGRGRTKKTAEQAAASMALPIVTQRLSPTRDDTAPPAADDARDDSVLSAGTSCAMPDGSRAPVLPDRAATRSDSAAAHSDSAATHSDSAARHSDSAAAHSDSADKHGSQTD